MRPSGRTREHPERRERQILGVHCATHVSHGALQGLRPANSRLNLGRPRDLVLPIDGPGWRKLARIVQASYRDVDAAGLFVTRPRQCSATCSAKFPGNAGGGIKGFRFTASDRELFGSYQEPPNRLGSGSAPAIGTMAHQ
jgi:hypothetical protein